MKNIFFFVLATVVMLSIQSCSKKQTPTTAVENTQNNAAAQDSVKAKPVITPGQKINSVQSIKLNPEQINKLKQAQQQEQQPANNSNQNALPGSTNPVAPSPEKTPATKPQ